VWPLLQCEEKKQDMMDVEKKGPLFQELGQIEYWGTWVDYYIK